MKPTLFFKIFLPVFTGSILLFSCSYYNVTGSKSETLTVVSADTTLSYLLQPYQNQVQVAMQEVVAVSDVDLKKEKPESSLGYWICDVLLESTSVWAGANADVALYNYGGLRLDQWYAGSISRSLVFELLPFDNLAVVLEADSAAIAQMVQRMISEGGWPMAGMQVDVQDGRAVSVLINQQPLNNKQPYKLVMNDYMAQGGDRLEFLMGLPVIAVGPTVRDILLQHCTELSGRGEHITLPALNRWVYGN